MADNNDKDLEPEVNLGEANIEGKNAAYFANLSSNVWDLFLKLIVKTK